MQESVAAVRQSLLLQLYCGGLQRQYLFLAPHGSRRPLPLVIMLHGAGDTSRGVLIQTGWAAKAVSEGFAVACPDAVRPDCARKPSFLENPQMWNSGYERSYAFEQGIDDSLFIQAVIDDVSRRTAIDSSRVYVTGFSDGAAMAFRCALSFPERLAAAAPVAGHCWLPLEYASLAARLPLLYIAGSEDPLNPPAGGMVRAPWGDFVYKPPAMDMLSSWAALNGCSRKPKPRAAGAGVTRLLFGSSKAGSCVDYYLVSEMGHVWPGGCNRLPPELAGKDCSAINATDLIWKFFSSHSRAGAACGALAE